MQNLNRGKSMKLNLVPHVKKRLEIKSPSRVDEKKRLSGAKALKSSSFKKAAVKFKSPTKVPLNTINISNKGAQFVGDQNSTRRPDITREIKKVRNKYREYDSFSSESSSEASAFLRKGPQFYRTCCNDEVVTDHSKPMWRPKFKWERTDFIIPGLNKKLDREAAKKSKVG